MFWGHYGLGFGSRGADRRAPLWALLLAVQRLDVVWGVLILAGAERGSPARWVRRSDPTQLQGCDVVVADVARRTSRSGCPPTRVATLTTKGEAQ